MEKRKWTNIKVFEEEIRAMREEGKTRQEIADHFGLEKAQIKGWVNRYNREQRRRQAGLPPKQRGRPRTKSLQSEQDYQRQINRLKMENQLLRDFLQSTQGR